MGAAQGRMCHTLQRQTGQDRAHAQGLPGSDGNMALACAREAGSLYPQASFFNSTELNGQIQAY